MVYPPRDWYSLSPRAMHTTIDTQQLTGLVRHQLEHVIPDGVPVAVDVIVRQALERLETCFARVKLRLYRKDGASYFDHLHSDQYATFLYLASNCAWVRGDDRLAAKLYCLNKAMNGFMCTYDTVLPESFLLIHTVGMLLGKAQYGNYFVALHDATIGTDRGKSPRLGNGLVIYGKASIIGDCDVGNNVSVSTGTIVRNQSISDAHVVAGVSPHLLLKPAKRVLIDEFFDLP